VATLGKGILVAAQDHSVRVTQAGLLSLSKLEIPNL
jgi:hypothetical protein